MLQKGHLSASLFIVLEIGLVGPRLGAWELYQGHRPAYAVLSA